MATARRLDARPEAVDLATARDYLRVRHTEDDALIEALVEAATDHVERTIRQVIGRQRWEVIFREAWIGLRFPIAPVTEIEEVAYELDGGAPGVLAPATYRLAADGLHRSLGSVAGSAWPSGFGTSSSVRCTVVAGIDPVPEGLRQAIKMLAAAWYETREAVTVGEQGAAVPLGVANLISTYRRFA